MVGGLDVHGVGEVGARWGRVGGGTTASTLLTVRGQSRWCRPGGGVAAGGGAGSAWQEQQSGDEGGDGGGDIEKTSLHELRLGCDTLAWIIYITYIHVYLYLHVLFLVYVAFLQKTH